MNEDIHYTRANEDPEDPYAISASVENGRMTILIEGLEMSEIAERIEANWPRLHPEIPWPGLEAAIQIIVGGRVVGIYGSDGNWPLTGRVVRVD